MLVYCDLPYTNLCIQSCLASYFLFVMTTKVTVFCYPFCLFSFPPLLLWPGQFVLASSLSWPLCHLSFTVLFCHPYFLLLFHSKLFFFLNSLFPCCLCSPYPQSRWLEEIPVSDRPDLLQFMFGWSSSDGISVQGEAEEGVMGRRTFH